MLIGIPDFSSPKPYTLEVVQKLREMGIKIGSTTGYTDSMMAVVVPNAKEQGYDPDAWFSPDSTQGLGRPYPYMIYNNMKKFDIVSVDEVVKVGDTVADVKEGKNAGVISLGVLEGSSVLGLSQEEYESLPKEERSFILNQARKKLLDAGADDVLLNLSELPEWLEKHA